MGKLWLLLDSDLVPRHQHRDDRDALCLEESACRQARTLQRRCEDRTGVQDMRARRC